MTSVGARIKERRNELGIKQGELARTVGLSQPTISNLEGDSSVKSREVARLAAALGVNALWLADGKGPKLLDENAPVVHHDISPKVLRLAERLALLPDDKLAAAFLLFGITLD